ncbi:MAG TPA: sigma-70 family RNA polymerase sigma factor [Rhizomicrobium sp.]|jgi:RNA polymerase sigma-70 factor (ECF subfamily)|nr:sigma-70 family RNA polymerase sigma factor [Rhizomicrobium sp.]
MDTPKTTEAATRESVWAGTMRAGLAGDSRNYRELLESITPHLRALVRRNLARAGAGNADAEDVVQEVLLAIHLKRHTWMTDQPFTPWLNAIARHKVIDALRKRGRRGEFPIDGLEEVLPAPAEEEGTSHTELERLVGRLDGRSHDIVSAISLEGKSIGDVAKAQSMSEGAVRVALHRGLKKLASLYQDPK